MPKDDEQDEDILVTTIEPVPATKLPSMMQEPRRVSSDSEDDDAPVVKAATMELAPAIKKPTKMSSRMQEPRRVSFDSEDEVPVVKPLSKINPDKGRNGVPQVNKKFLRSQANKQTKNRVTRSN